MVIFKQFLWILFFYLLCTPCWPGIIGSPTLVYQVLGLQVCVARPPEQFFPKENFTLKFQDFYCIYCIFKVYDTIFFEFFYFLRLRIFVEQYEVMGFIMRAPYLYTIRLSYIHPQCLQSLFQHLLLLLIFSSGQFGFHSSKFLARYSYMHLCSQHLGCRSKQMTVMERLVCPNQQVLDQ